MPKMLFSKIRFYDIKDLINGNPTLNLLTERRRQDNHSAAVTLKCFTEYQHSFRSFLQSEFSEENLDFWLACEDFRTISSEEELRRRAQQIYQEFLQTTAKREVNVDHWIREKILVSLDKPNALCFREAQKHVYALMERDSWPRYTHSQKCQSMGTKSRTLWYI
uniref:RGS domain-containing protein n=1 Tax=Periophthalmus magnuspinnatus TaxID=409849 RepID=A0A3B4B1D8_9GOBI